mgnify:FL=1
MAELAVDEARALLDRLGAGPGAAFADLGGGALPLAIAAGRCGLTVTLVDLDHRGRWPARPSAWVAPYRAALAEAGLPDGAVRVAARPEALVPQDLVANLAGFGDRHKAAHLATVLPPLLRAGTRVLTDIRKGSGAYPVLKPLGACETLSTHEADGKPVARVLLTASAAPDAGPGWSRLAAELAGPDGFFDESGRHSVLFVPRGDTLVVTFDNLDIAMTKREDRRPWGYSFIERQGWSMLGVMAGGWTWYRDPWVWATFDRLRETGFFARFARVVFYGASMGGYAACAFAPACPGADVVAISPQSTLDRALVPWETRYRTAWGADFSGPYGDAAVASRAARRVTILYDPYEPLDAAHAARFDGPNVMALRAPLLGHRLGSSLQQMGILAPITLAALAGTLTEAEFYRTLRARKGFQRYQRELFKRAMDRGRPGLARRLGRYVLTRGDNRWIRRALERM